MNEWVGSPSPEPPAEDRAIRTLVAPGRSIAKLTASNGYPIKDLKAASGVWQQSPVS